MSDLERVRSIVESNSGRRAKGGSQSELRGSLAQRRLIVNRTKPSGGQLLVAYNLQSICAEDSRETLFLLLSFEMLGEGGLVNK